MDKPSEPMESPGLWNDTADEVELVKGDYEALLQEHIGGSMSMGWRSVDEQQMRFKVLREVVDLHMDKLGHVLDVGCGRGEFFNTRGLMARGMNFYTGVDFMEPHVGYAKGKWGKFANTEFVQEDAITWLENAKPVYDTVIASGLFAHYSGATTFKLIERMWHVTNRCLAFNWSKFTTVLRPSDVLRCFNQLDIDCYVLRHDYHPHDWTVYAYKQP